MSSGKADTWGPSLELPTSGTSTPPPPGQRGSRNNAAAAATATPPPAVSAYDAYAGKPLAEDPAYQAALQQAIKSAGLEGTQLATAITSKPARAPLFAAGAPTPSHQHGHGGHHHAAPKTPAPTPQTQSGYNSSSGAASGVKESKEGKAGGRNAQQHSKPAVTTAPVGGSNKAAAAAAAAAAADTTPAKPKGANHQAPPAATPPAATPGTAGKAGANKGPGSGGAGSKTPGGGQQWGGSKVKYEEYLGQDALQKLAKSGCAFRGKIRVNATDRREAYLTVPGLPHDVLIRGEKYQNRAIDGDEVVVRVNAVSEWYRVHKHMGPEDEAALCARLDKIMRLDGGGKGVGDPDLPWASLGSVEAAKASMTAAVQAAPAGGLRITGRVVGLGELSVRRERVVGVLQAGAPGAMLGGERLLWLLPLDPCLPGRCAVAATSVKGLSPELLAEASQAADAEEAGTSVASRTLMSARVTGWDTECGAPLVELRASLGQAGEIESETAAILELQGVRSDDFEPEVLACLPKTPWNVSDQDLSGRRDFRSHRVFSIDPPTAKDLDDALHIHPVPNKPGRWKVGVHIADVAHFIPPFSALDIEAGRRSTSVYLVQRVIPMLPRLLCEELCSLNPGVDRFAFSVEWELDEAGVIHEQWAGRSIIRSRAKLAYPMVQAMIEERFDADACPAKLSDGATWPEVIGDCLALHTIARNLRAARHANGALRLDNCRLTFALDKEGNPTGCGQYVQQEANQLVEEYMLLANMSVARLISDAFPDRALLRSHPPPNARKLTELCATLAKHGVQLDGSSSGALAASLAAMRAAIPEVATQEAITAMATRPMQLATYFCTGLAGGSDNWVHFALAVGEYTHFTSPIRRYPDVMVHRLLAAAIEIREGANACIGARVPAPQRPVPTDVESAAAAHRLLGPELCGKVAEHCNERRLGARKAQDSSLNLYLCVLLRRHPAVTAAVVTGLGGDKFFTAYLPAYGQEARISLDQAMLPLAGRWDAGAQTLVITMGDTSGSASASDSTATPSGSRGPRGPTNGSRGFGGRGAGGSQHGRGGRGEEQGEHAQQQGYGEWLAGLPAVRNPDNLMPVMFPLKLAMFDQVPVILYSPLKPGKISEVVARLWVSPQCYPAPGGTAGAAPATVVVQEEVPQLAAEKSGFSIPYGEMLND
mmetsp:Transcript_30979/g.79024  ORF Transcript_30979/g.79024 Transcript_30979/m.79024 type:complete len:1166 (-) Transcript_30979:319-3816(-)